MTADRSLHLLPWILLLGVMPLIMRLIANFQHFGVTLAILALNLVLCALGTRTGRFRWFWIAYAAACAISFALFGMTSPISFLVAFAT